MKQIDEQEKSNETDEQPDGVVMIEVSKEDKDLAIEPSAQVDPTSVEALLFSTHSPLTAGKLGEMLGLDNTKSIRHAIKTLNDEYEKSGRSFRIEQVAGGYQMLTLPEFGTLIKRLVQKDGDAKLTKAALESLAIIALQTDA